VLSGMFSSTKMIRETIFYIISMTFIGSLAGAVIMAIAGGISHTYFVSNVEHKDEKSDSSLELGSEG
jgi:hypothetical protein